MNIEWEYKYRSCSAIIGNYTLTINRGAYNFIWLVEKDDKEVATGITNEYDTARELCSIVVEKLVKAEYKV